MTVIPKRLWAVLAAVVLLAAAGVPARAAQLEWTDATGDGSPESDRIGPVSALYAGSLDITQARLKVEAARLQWDLTVVDLDEPLPSYAHGRDWAFYFDFNGGEFSLTVRQWGPDPDEIGLLYHGEGQLLDCARCRFQLLPAQDTVRVSVPLETLRETTSRVAGSPGAGLGSTLQSVSVGTGVGIGSETGGFASVGPMSLVADSAPATADFVL